jgi:hypothetical protein
MQHVVDQLRGAGFDAATQASRDNIVDLLVRGYLLDQVQCVEASADLVLPIPTTFPSTPPYGFFALTSLTSRRGPWRNVSAAQPYPSAQFFSRKCDGWNAAVHDVFTYLAFINRWVANG